MGTQLPQKGAQPPHFRPMSIVAKWLYASGYATWYGGRLQPRRHCVRWGLSSPRKGAQQPLPLLAHVYCGQTAGWIKMSLSREVDLCTDGVVLDGDPLASSPKGHSPEFSAHVCCGQTAGWIEMPLGTEVDLGPGHIVLDGDPASQGGTAAPLFSAHICCGQVVAHLSYC